MQLLLRDSLVFLVELVRLGVVIHLRRAEVQPPQMIDCGGCSRYWRGAAKVGRYLRLQIDSQLSELLEGRYLRFPIILDFA